MYTSALGHKRTEGFSDRRQSEPILLSCPHAAGKHRKEAHWFLARTRGKKARCLKVGESSRARESQRPFARARESERRILQSV